MPFYLRATEAVLASAVQNPIGDDAFPDQQDGVDHDGRLVLSWTFPADSPARPCGYRVEEAVVGSEAGLFADNGDEPLAAGANSKWSGSAQWTSQPHPGTLTLGYAPVYTDNINVSLTTRNAITLPPSALVNLSFTSFEDLERDFDFAFVEVNTDGGTTFTADNDAEGPGPPILSYHWSFGDGATATSSAATTSHSYSAAGTYRIVLTITDNDGESASAEALQTVSEPDAAISGGGHIPVSGGRADFSVDISMSDGVITKAKARYEDRPARMKVQSTKVTRVDRIGNRATIYGDCTINKTQTGTFRMEVVDSLMRVRPRPDAL